MTTENRKQFFISTDKFLLDVSMIHTFLKNSYWAKNISRETVEKSIKNSVCFGVYEEKKQIGFARVISDYATSALLKDVFILESYRGQGLGKYLVKYILEYPELRDIPRWLLGTQDAHGLYRRYGFENLTDPERIMIRFNSESDENLGNTKK